MARTLRISARPLDRPPLAPGRSGPAPRRRRSRAWIVESLEGWTLLSAGDLDPTFGVGGKVVTPFIGDNFTTQLALQSDGKPVLVSVLNNAIQVVRCNADGSLDTSFGPGGLSSISMGPHSAGSAGYSGFPGIILQSDGKIVVEAHAEQQNQHVVVARLESDGHLDTSFGVQGIVDTDLSALSLGGAAWNTIGYQANGGIIVAGGAGMERFDSNGHLDTTFGIDGHMAIALAAVALAIQSDGKIVLAGYQFNSVSFEFAVERFTPDGLPDPSFGTGGLVTTDFSPGGAAYGVAQQSDGKILAVGTAFYHQGATDFATARYEVDGRLDPSFGLGGRVTTNFGADEQYGHSVAIQGDGKIVVVGYTISPSAFVVARYDSDGRLDTSFGSGGWVTTRFGLGESDATEVAIQGDGKIVVAGSFRRPLGYQLVVARYEGDSTPQGNPPTADAGGPYAIREGDPLQLDAAASNDPDGDPLAYAWDVNGDGTFTDAVGVQPTLTWARLQALGITDSGSYSVKVQVYDGHGHVVTSPAASLSVANTAPTAAITGAPATGPEGGAIVLTASATDPSNADTAAGFAYSWAVTKDGAPYATGSGPSLTFTPDDDGTYVVHLTATDRDGDSGADSRTIVVTDVAPTATLSNDGPADTGVPVTVQFTNPFDPSAADTAAGFHYAFATDPAVLAQATYQNSGAAPSASFTFDAAGTYTVHGRILDRDGGYTDYATAITVIAGTHVAPEVTQYVINGGQAQRSDVASIAVGFNRSTNLAQLIADGTIRQAVQVVGPAGVVDLPADRYR